MKPIRDVYPDLIDEASPCMHSRSCIGGCVCVRQFTVLFDCTMYHTMHKCMYTQCTFEVQCCSVCVCVCVFTVLFDPELCHVVHKFVYTLYACV